MGEPNLSQAEQVSQGGEPTVDRGDPFGLLGYDCRWLKLERVRQGFFRGRFWIPVRKSRTKRLTEISTSTYANTHRSVKHSFNSVCHKMLYSNIHNTSPQWQSIDDSVRYQRAKGPNGRQHKSWESTFGAPHEHATHHTTPPDAFPEQSIVHARPRNKVRYGSWFAGPAAAESLTARPV